MAATEVLVGVAASVTAVGVLWRQAVRPVVRGVRSIATKLDALDEVLPKIADLEVVSKAVHAQLIPNGGQSLADYVAQAGTDAKDARRTARRVERKMHALKVEIDTLIAPAVTEAPVPSALVPTVTSRRRSRPPRTT